MKILTQLTPFFKQKQITPFKGNGSDHLNPWYCIQKYGEKKGKNLGIPIDCSPNVHNNECISPKNSWPFLFFSLLHHTTSTKKKFRTKNSYSRKTTTMFKDPANYYLKFQTEKIRFRTAPSCLAAS